MILDVLPEPFGRVRYPRTIMQSSAKLESRTNSYCKQRPPITFVPQIGGSMPRYHLHLRRSCTRIFDDAGSEFPSLEAAREEALISARELIAIKVRDGRLPLDWMFEIADEDGIVVLSVPFTDAVTSKPGPL
jgi:hypothetical protein